jgi:UDP-glucose 4-epimerase
MRILITGVAGFIGSNLAEYHLNKGDIVYGVDDLTSGAEVNIQQFNSNPHFRFVKNDIITWPQIEKYVIWSDRIYHMAAIVGVYRVLKEPERVLAINIAGCERLLRSVKNCDWKPQVLIASSSEVYGPSEKSQFSENDNLIIECEAKNRWNYPVSKLADEALGLAYFRKFDIPTIMVRLFNTVGPRQTGRYGMVLPNFINQAINNQPITVFGDGEQTRSFCDVRDLVVMLDKLASNEKSAGEILNVGNDEEITINQLAEKVKKIANSSSEIKHVSYEEAYGEPYVDTRRRKPDLKKLLSFIDNKFEWPLEKTIKNLIENS